MFPVDFTGTRLGVGVDVTTDRSDTAAAASATNIARAADGNEVHVSETLASLIVADVPDGLVVRVALARARGSRAPIFRLARARDEVPNNLSDTGLPLIGREEQIESLTRLLENTNLVTVSGPPGTGKSRLAAEIANRLLGRFVLGAWFVSLAPIQDSELTLSTVAETIGLPMSGPAQPLDALVAHIGARTILVVLDNFEHVSAATGDVVALLDRAPGLTILVTSQSPLHLVREHELTLLPLSTTAPAAGTARSPAHELFRQRAAAADPMFRPNPSEDAQIAELCRRLDGLPLAIELAAARTSVLSPAAIIERLDRQLELTGSRERGSRDRHHSLRDTIAWSYDLLDSPSRDLFRRLSVFRGGFTVEAAAAVWQKDAADEAVVDGFTTLRDASLILRDVAHPQRFFLLETLRQFAAARLDDVGGSDDASRSHAAYFAGIAERLGPQILGPSQARVLDELASDQDNLRASLEFLLHADPIACVRLCGNIWRFWQMRGHLVNGRRWITAALDSVAGDAPPEDLASGHAAAGGVAYWLGDLEETENHYLEVVRLRRAIGADRGIADALFDLAFVFDPSLRPPPEDPLRTREGIRIADEAHERYRAAGDEAGIAKSEWLLGSIVAGTDLPRATQLLSSSVARFRAVGDPFGLGWALHSYGLTLLRGEDAEGASATFGEALRLFGSVGDASATALLLDDFAEVAKAEGDALRAARLKGAASAQRDASQVILAMENAPWLTADRDPDRGTIDPTFLERAWVEGAALSSSSAVAYALGEANADSVEVGLRVAALGPFEVVRSGVPISDWGGPKAGNRHALAIFAFLVDRGERGVTKDEFVEVLWPDAEVEQGDLNFHRTLGGLRSTLGSFASRNGVVIFANGRYRLRPDVVTWIDADEFEQLVRHAGDATDAAAAIRSLERARVLYRGDYFDDCPLYGDSVYVEERRDFLRGRLVDTLVDLGRRYEQRHDDTLASERYRQALEASDGDCPSAREGLARLGVNAA